MKTEKCKCGAPLVECGGLFILKEGTQFQESVCPKCSHIKVVVYIGKTCDELVCEKRCEQSPQREDVEIGPLLNGG